MNDVKLRLCAAEAPTTSADLGRAGRDAGWEDGYAVHPHF